MHVPQIIKKHTHTRTIFKHHFVKPKGGGPKNLVNARLDPTFKLARKLPNSIAALDSGRFKSSEQLWKPQTEYRGVESSYLPKKIKLGKKKNPFKLLEIMAEAQAEGHNFSPQSLYNEDYFDHDANEHIPEYMLSDNSRFHPSEVYQTADATIARNSAHKAELLHMISDDKLNAATPQYTPSWAFAPPTIETATKTYDWSTGLANSDFKKQNLFSAAIDDSDEFETIQPKPKKHRNKSRLAPTQDTTDDHENILKMTRKPISLTNFTKYKNKYNVLSSLNTSI